MFPHTHTNEHAHPSLTAQHISTATDTAHRLAQQCDPQLLALVLVGAKVYAPVLEVLVLLQVHDDRDTLGLLVGFEEREREGEKERRRGHAQGVRSGRYAANRCSLVISLFAWPADHGDNRQPQVCPTC